VKLADNKKTRAGARVFLFVNSAGTLLDACMPPLYY
jgi:hypothetical protein